MSQLKYFFEDMQPGKKVDLGEYNVSAGEIIHFAEQFDPAPFHLDEKAGKESFLGGLAASGWHVCSIAMKMICDTYLLESTSQGSPGMRECKWMAPVLAGDTLSGHMVIESARLSASRPGLGFLEFRLSLFNQNSRQVLSFQNTGMMLTRETARQVAGKEPV